VTGRPNTLTRRSAAHPAGDRLGNVVLAFMRFFRVWSPGIPTEAWRRFRRSWPIWAVGLVTMVVFAIWLDGPSVAWARGLPHSVSAGFEWITRYGKSDWLLYPSGILCIVLLLANWRCVSRRMAAAWTEIGILAGFGFVSIAGSGILTNIIKQLVGRGRPINFELNGAFDFLPFQFNYAQASFPSGHATTMGALAVVIMVIAPRLRYPALALCGLVAASRVFVGSHFPSDVAGGFLLGAAFTWFYVLALTEAGIGFARAPTGTIRARVMAMQRVWGGSRGPSIALAGLWSAIVGKGSRKISA
jgi:membrane-associated phospholipid phosphatase